MAKFKVAVSETITIYYKTVEIEASTPEEAIIEAETRAMNGELDEVRSKSDFSSDARRS